MDLTSFLAANLDWDANDIARHLQDPQVDGVFLVVNDTRQQAIIAYVDMGDAEEVDYNEAKQRYFK